MVQSQVDSQDSHTHLTVSHLLASSSASKRSSDTLPCARSGSVLASSCSLSEARVSVGCTPAFSHSLTLDCSFSLGPQHWGWPLSSALFFSHSIYHLTEYFSLLFFIQGLIYPLLIFSCLQLPSAGVTGVCSLVFCVSSILDIRSMASYILGRHSVTGLYLQPSHNL